MRARAAVRAQPPLARLLRIQKVAFVVHAVHRARTHALPAGSQPPSAALWSRGWLLGLRGDWSWLVLGGQESRLHFVQGLKLAENEVRWVLVIL